MPLYDFECDECGVYESFAKYREDPEHICDHCGGKAMRLPSAPMVTGPTDTKPFKIDHAGKEFTSRAAMNKWLSENPTNQMLSATDPKWIKHRDGVREKADRRAKQRGFRDFDDQRAQKRAETKRRNELKAGGEKKIISY